MDINATLLGQMITFTIFVWFTMRFVWPLLQTTLNERKQKIAEGLAAAEKGQQSLTDAQAANKVQLKETKEHCHRLIQEANRQATQIVEAAKDEAYTERKDIVEAGRMEVIQSKNQAKVDLQTQFADVVVRAVEKILSRQIHLDDHRDILDKLSKELS